MTKICCRCKEAKELVDFAAKNKANGTYQAYCKECKKAYNKKWYANEQNKQNQIDRATKNNSRYLEDFINWRGTYIETHGGCSYDGCDVINPIMIDFDHLDRTTKVMDIGTMARRGFNILKIEEEAAKCRLLCANHHRLWTAEQMGWTAYVSMV